MLDLGIVKPGKTIRIPINTFDSNDPQTSATVTSFAAADIEIYKDGSTTQRASDSGYTVTVDFDTTTGVQLVAIDLADNTTAGFFASGSEYIVIAGPFTLDAATVNAAIARFEIGMPDADLNTTIATLASQVSFTLTAGPAEDNALNGCIMYAHDVASAVQGGYAVVSDYTGSTKTVTLTASPTFTMAATDNVHFYPPTNVSYWNQVALATTNPLPNAAADAAGGLPISDAGGLDLDTLLGYLTAAVATATELAKVPKSDGTVTFNATALASINGEADTALSDFFTSSAQLVDDIWDEILTGATHNTTDSAGKRIRDLQEYGTYSGGAIFIDTVNGTAGTTDYENGTFLFPVASIADANTIAASLNLARFRVTPGSSITFAATQSGEVFHAHGSTIALGGQDISDTHIIGATVSGTATATGSPTFDGCTIGTVNLPTSYIENSFLNGTLTLGEAGNYNFVNSHGEGLTGCTVDFGAAIGNNTLTFCNWSGVLELQNMGQTGTDAAGIGGCGIITINANCTGGTLYLIGNFSVTDNSGGAVTIVYSDIETTANATLVDTGTTLPALIGTPADTDLATDIANIAAVLPTDRLAVDVTFTGGTTTTAVLGNVDGAAASSTDDVYNNRVLVFNAGTLDKQVAEITDYVGSTKTATISAVTTAVTSGHTAILI